MTAVRPGGPGDFSACALHEDCRADPRCPMFSTTPACRQSHIPPTIVVSAEFVAACNQVVADLARALNNISTMWAEAARRAQSDNEGDRR